LIEKYALCISAATYQPENSKQRVKWKNRAETSREQIRVLAENANLPRQLAERLHTAARLQWASQKLQIASITLQLAAGQWSEVDDESVIDQQDAATSDLAALFLDIAAHKQRPTLTKSRHLSSAPAIYSHPFIERHPDDEYYPCDLQTIHRRLRVLQASAS